MPRMIDLSDGENSVEDVSRNITNSKPRGRRAHVKCFNPLIWELNVVVLVLLSQMLFQHYYTASIGSKLPIWKFKTGQLGP